MSELSQEARNLIESAAFCDDPTEMDRIRMRSKLAAQLGAAAFAGTLGAVASNAMSASAGTSANTSALLAGGASSGLLKSASLSALAKSASLSALAKSAIAASFATVLGVAMWTAQPDEAQGPTSSLSLPKTVSVTPAPEPGPVVESLAPTAQIAAEPMAAVPSDVPAHGASDLAQRHAASSRPENTLTQELSLLAQAQDALRADNPSGALAFAREHKRRYPRGSLREERQGIEALARCSLGHNGLKVLDELQRVSPNSPLLERVRTACIKP